jgi:hypothetical protein
MQKIVSTFLAFTVVFGLSLAPIRAAETKPIAALAVTSYNNLLEDVNFVGKLIDRPQTGPGLEALLTIFTQGRGLAGVDKTRPAGVIVLANGDEDPAHYVFVPVTKFKDTLGLLKLWYTAESENGIYKLTPKDGKQNVYLKHQGAWAFLSDKAETLAHTDANPLSVLGDLNKGYILAGRVFLANVPDGLRDKFLAQIKENAEKESAQKDGESDEEHASRKKVSDQIEAYAARVLSELDEVAMSWNLDRDAEKVSLDFSVTARPGSLTAEEMDLAAKSTTKFSGFRAPAALNAALASPIPAAKQQIAASLIEAVRGKFLSEVEKHQPAEKKEGAKGVVNEIGDLLQKIVKSGHVDGAATVLLKPNAATALVGGYIADGAALDKILHTIAAAFITDHPEVEQFVKLDAEKVHSINFHKISIPIPESADNHDAVVQMIGEHLDIVIGVGQESAYLAAGRNALPALKKAIEGSARAGAKSVSPVDISLAVEPVASMTAAVGKPDDRPKAAWAETELKKLPGKDHVSLSIRPISNGVQAHLEVEQGLVRLAGRMVVSKLQPSEN